MRAALYARFSDDKQNARSADDQLAACRVHAAARGWTVVAEFKDEAISGWLMVNRPGINAMLEAAAAGGFDVLLTEDEDRVARRLQHQALIWDDLEELGIQWATLHTEKVELMHVAFKGAMAQGELTKLSRKTKRGQASVARDGRHNGGRVYGYRIVREFKEDGSYVAGLRAVKPDEAAIVVEIFERYAAGESPRGIAGDPLQPARQTVYTGRKWMGPCRTIRLPTNCRGCRAC